MMSFLCSEQFKYQTENQRYHLGELVFFLSFSGLKQKMNRCSSSLNAKNKRQKKTTSSKENR